MFITGERDRKVKSTLSKIKQKPQTRKTARKSENNDNMKRFLFFRKILTGFQNPDAYCYTCRFL